MTGYIFLTVMHIVIYAICMSLSKETLLKDDMGIAIFSVLLALIWPVVDAILLVYQIIHITMYSNQK